MIICIRTFEKKSDNTAKDEPKEIVILKEIYRRLTDKNFDDEYEKKERKK
jgi:hypothetical protein